MRLFIALWNTMVTRVTRRRFLRHLISSKFMPDFGRVAPSVRFFALMLTFGFWHRIANSFDEIADERMLLPHMRLRVLVSIVWLFDESRVDTRRGRMIVEVLMSRFQSSAVDLLVNGRHCRGIFHLNPQDWNILVETVMFPACLTPPDSHVTSCASMDAVLCLTDCSL